jgi:hypothetical protein
MIKTSLRMGRQTSSESCLQTERGVTRIDPPSQSKDRVVDEWRPG